ETVEAYAAKVELEVIYQRDYLLEDFLAHVAANPLSRCDYCYQSRLAETARTAAEKGFDAFSTSLLYSRYQQHERIREYGEHLAALYAIPFVYKDFREGWRQGIEASKSMGLYRQQYCGCIYSEKDRYYPRHRN
ncbi:MAG TPA: epoxyqueuosine reductase QueH, partial [Desulfuromonadales bacterium]|nr:epoxyqueuosine reductase QueH [Desulfuromonadales bacterium]